MVEDGSGHASDLLTAVVNPTTHQLDLKFTPGKTGVATVKVNVAKPGETPVMDEFTVTIKPNLLAQISNDGLLTAMMPGDKGTAQVTLVNNSGGVAKGLVKATLYLSESSGTSSDLAGYTLSEADREIGSSTFNLNLASGAATSVPVKFAVSNTELLANGKVYRVLVKIESPAGSTLEELYVDDNVGHGNALHSYNIAFGKVGTRTNAPLTILDSNGDLMTLRLSGGGKATVTKAADGSVDISIVGSTASSVLSVTTAKGVIADIDDIFINDVIGSAKLGNVHLHGFFTASSGIKSVVFGDLGNMDGTQPELSADKSIIIGSFTNAAQKVRISAGKVHDYSLESSMPIEQLVAKEWLNQTGQVEHIVAQGIGTLKITAGNLESDVILGARTTGLFSVSGALKGANVRSSGGFTTVSLGSMEGSTFLAGISEKPTLVSDFAVAKNISAFTIRGLMSDSVVAAGRIGTTKVSSVDATAGTAPWGFYVDALTSYVRGTVRLANLNQASVGGDVKDSVAPNYEVRVF
jgi:hypothetical protein